MTPIANPGLHIIIDFWEATNLQDCEYIKKALTEAAAQCDAKVLDIKLHSFGDGAGVTGVALLAESHISIHTWPETGFVALDVFMCGNCNPEIALPILRNAFKPKKESIHRIQRGFKPSLTLSKLRKVESF